MKNNIPRPKWFIPYGLFLALLVSMWLEVNAPISKAGHIWAEIGLVLFFYRLVLGWLKANEIAILRDDRERRKFAEKKPRIRYYYKLDAPDGPQAAQKEIHLIDSTRPLNERSPALAWIAAIIAFFGGIFRHLE